MSTTLADVDVCTQPKYWSGTQNITIAVDGQERLFQLYSPWESRGQCGPSKWCTGPPTSPVSGVILNWHGCNDHLPLIDYHTEISKVSQEAQNRGGYFTITPLGTRSPGNTWGWNADGIPCGKVGVDDFAFFEAIYEWIGDNLCVDRQKLYSVGFSTGAFLSYGLACRYPQLITAIGTDAGGLSRPELATCAAGQGAVPVQSFHSLTDPTVPYNGTQAWAGQLEMDALWRSRNGCTDTDRPRISFQSPTTRCLLWECPDGNVESCTLQDIDHCWYGGRSGGFPSCAPRPGDIDATVHMFTSWEALAGKGKKTEL